MGFCPCYPGFRIPQDGGRQCAAILLVRTARSTAQYSVTQIENPLCPQHSATDYTYIHTAGIGLQSLKNDCEPKVHTSKARVRQLDDIENGVARAGRNPTPGHFKGTTDSEIICPVAPNVELEL